jgi:hypothetical protein
MGDAIARFRDMALAIRRICDERHSQPRRGAVTAAAAKKFAKECRLHLLDHEKRGLNYPARYVHGLCRRRGDAERHPEPPKPGHFNLSDYIEWLPEPFKGKEPGHSEIRKAVREAVKEAVKWGSVFPVVEARIKALDAAADLLLQYAGAGFHQPPSDKYWCEDATGGGYCGPTEQESDNDYISAHEQFAEALDAIAPFIEENPAPAATSETKTGGTKQKKHRDRKGVGGAPEKYSLKFIREVFAARERDQKHAAKAKRRLPAWAPWLWDYCENSVDIAKRFPPKFKGEPWQARAERFRKAAKKRLKDPNGN